MRQKLNIITLGAKDLNTTVLFFEQGLGWKRSAASQGDLVLFDIGGIVLALYPRDLLADDIGIENTENGFAGITIAYNTKSPEEVNEVLELARKAGATIVKPAKKVFWGGYSGYFSSPDGHLFEVAYNPFWNFDKDDNLILG